MWSCLLSPPLPLRCCCLAPVDDTSSLWCAMSGALGHLGIPPRSSEQPTFTCGTEEEEEEEKEER